MTHWIRIVVIGAALTVLVTSAASAQSPSMTIKTDEAQRVPPEVLEKREQVDKAYQDAIKKTPTTAQKPVDPWGNVRPTTNATDKSAKGR